MGKKNDLSWMPLDVIDWLLSRRVTSLPPTARAGYLDLLCWHWREGKLPNNDDDLRCMARLTLEEWAEHRQAILSFFTKHRDGNLYQTRVVNDKKNARKNLKRYRQQTANAREQRIENARRRIESTMD